MAPHYRSIFKVPEDFTYAIRTENVDGTHRIHVSPLPINSTMRMGLDEMAILAATAPIYCKFPCTFSLLYKGEIVEEFSFSPVATH